MVPTISDIATAPLGLHSFFSFLIASSIVFFIYLPIAEFLVAISLTPQKFSTQVLNIFNLDERIPIFLCFNVSVLSSTIPFIYIQNTVSRGISPLLSLQLCPAYAYSYLAINLYLNKVHQIILLIRVILY